MCYLCVIRSSGGSGFTGQHRSKTRVNSHLAFVFQYCVLQMKRDWKAMPRFFCKTGKLTCAKVVNFSLWQIQAVIVSVWQCHLMHGDETDPYWDSNVNFYSNSDDIRLFVSTWQPVEQNSEERVSPLACCVPLRFFCWWSSSCLTFRFSPSSPVSAFPTVSPPKVRKLWKPEGCCSLGLDLPKGKRQRRVTHRCFAAIKASAGVRLLTLCISAGFSMLVFEWCGLKCLLPADSLSKHSACSFAHGGKVNNGLLLKEPQLAGDGLVGWDPIIRNDFVYLFSESSSV